MVLPGLGQASVEVEQTLLQEAFFGQEVSPLQKWQGLEPQQAIDQAVIGLFHHPVAELRSHTPWPGRMWSMSRLSSVLTE